ncbi:MAG: hypothetical protein ABJN22_10245 [Litorimonas sp.]
MRSFWLATAICLFPAVAFAQDYGLSGPAEIESEALGAAQDFDAGILQEGALATNLWQGTSAGWAARLLSNAPLKSKDPIIRDMVRTVVLSGGVPPRANSPADAQAYETARLQAVLAIESGQSGDQTTLDGFLARNPELARAPLAQVDLALSKGNWQRACEISDTVTTERGRPEWARLRAACHALRGEISAADVTRDLLRSSGYENPAYHAQMDALLTGRGPAAETDQTDALVTFLATRNAAPEANSTLETDPNIGPEADLAALFESFGDTDIEVIASALGNLSFDIAEPDLDLETAMSEASPRATARLFVLGQSGDAAAFDAFLSRAIRAGVDEDIALTKLTPIIQALPASARVNSNLARYTRAAFLSRDLSGLQQLYAALPEGPMQARLALITDALGGGFYGQSMGRDIEGRLAVPLMRTQAVTDAQVALALGASLSDPAAVLLSEQTLPALTLPQNQLLLLDAAIRDNSQAEVSLLVATLLTRSGLNTTDKSRLISALTQAGLQRFAGQIAAEIYFDGLDAAL